MLNVLANQIYCRLFAAQVIALVGTGLATVALGLLAYDIAGGDAGAVLGTALAIKMVAYVTVAPVASAFVNRFSRRAVLITMDVLRATVAMFLPFVEEVWQIYVLIFALQSCSAVFTPSFQATIPDVLPDEEDYTKALSLSRLAYDLESLLSPTLAAGLLALMTFQWLFLGTAVGFVASAVLVLSVLLPKTEPSRRAGGFYERTTAGIRIYLRTPRLRGLLALTAAAAAAGAMVIVNTVVILRDLFGRTNSDVAVALAAYGLGSMLTALLLPRFLAETRDRTVMLVGAGAILSGLIAGIPITAAGTTLAWPMLLILWFILGGGYAAIVTPSGRLLRRSAHGNDRPLLFAAQFALSHACWLITYPLAGWAGASLGISAALALLAGLAAIGLVMALRTWPRRDPTSLDHVHDNLPAGHEHLEDAKAVASGQFRHAHDYAIDDLHPRWP